MSECQHECDPYPTEPILVSDEEFYASPLRMNWGPPRIVPCKHCGAPMDRGRYDQKISIPALREEWPFGRDEEDGMGNIEHWPDEHAIQTVARRIERFGWPYKQNSEAIVRQVVVELRKLEPPQPQGAVEALREIAGNEAGSALYLRDVACEALAAMVADPTTGGGVADGQDRG